MKSGVAFPKPVKVFAEQLDEAEGRLKSTDGNTYNYKKGDYKLWDNRGPEKAWIVDRDIFEMTYERIGNGEYQKRPLKTPFQIADKDGIIKTLEGPVNYKKGDYIITGPKGETYPMPAERFEQRYHKIKWDKMNTIEKAISSLQIDLGLLAPGIPEHASLVSVTEYQQFRLMHKEHAGATSAIGRYAIYLMYFGLIIYLRDKKLTPPKSLMNDLRAARTHVPDQELVKKYAFPKKLLLNTDSPQWVQDNLPALRKINQTIAEDVKIPENERKLFLLAVRACKGDIAASSLKSLEKVAWVVSPDLGGKVTQHIHGEAGDTTSAAKKASTSGLSSAHTALRAAVKGLGGSGLTLSLDAANKARSNSRTEGKYKEYLKLRSDIRKQFEVEFRKLIVGNNNKPMEVKEAEKKMQAKGFELLFMPTASMGFVGKVGLNKGKPSLYTVTDKLIRGNIAPNAKVKMNPKYDPITDNVYVMSVKAQGALGTARLYTEERNTGATATKFKKADDLGKKLPMLLKSWGRDLRSDDPLARMNATASVCLYLTGARAGSKSDGMASKKGVAAFGMMNLRNKHVKVTSTNIIFNYPGKKGVIQKHVIPLRGDKGRKLIAKHLLEVKEDKGPNDPLWTLPSLTGKRTIVANYTTLTQYCKRIGLTQGAHKLRHVRGTELAKKLIGEAKFKFSRAATTLAKRKREADDFMKNKILSKVADLLGHRSTGADGGLKMAWNTSIKSYVNPNVVREWYVEHKLDVPNWVPASVAIEK